MMQSKGGASTSIRDRTGNSRLSLRQRGRSSGPKFGIRSARAALKGLVQGFIPIGALRPKCSQPRGPGLQDRQCIGAAPRSKKGFGLVDQLFERRFIDSGTPFVPTASAVSGCAAENGTSARRRNGSGSSSVLASPASETANLASSQRAKPSSLEASSSTSASSSSREIARRCFAFRCSPACAWLQMSLSFVASAVACACVPALSFLRALFIWKFTFA